MRSPLSGNRFSGKLLLAVGAHGGGDAGGNSLGLAFLGHVNLHTLTLGTVVLHHGHGQSLGLRYGAGIAIEQAAAILVLAQPLSHDAVHYLIGYEHGGVHVLLGLQAQLGTGGNLSTQQSAGAQGLEIIGLGQERGLSTLAGSRGAYKYESLERFHKS